MLRLIITIALLSPALAGAQSARRVANLNDAGPSNPDGLVRIGNQVFFAARTASGRRPWVTDGTASGTTAVQFPVGASLAAVGTGGLTTRAAEGLVLFNGFEGGRATLWSYQPSSDQLHTVARVGDGGFGDFTVSGGTIFYLARTSALSELTLHAAPLDGGATRALGGLPSKNPQLAAFARGVLFDAFSADAGDEPWFSDGTLSGTGMVADLGPDSTSSFPRAWVVSGGLAYFFGADDAGVPRSLYVTDGGRDGTRSIVWSGGPLSSLVPQVEGVYFAQADRVWSARAQDTPVQVPGSYIGPTRLVPFRTGLAFAGVIPFLAGFPALFVVEAAGATAEPANVFLPGDGVTSLTTAGTGLAMRALTDAGDEPWMSAGREGPTLRVADINPGPADSLPGYGAQLVSTGTSVLFNATDEGGDTELWAIDIDLTPPIITPNVTSQRVDGGWFLADVSVIFDPRDDESSMLLNGCDPRVVDVDGTTVLSCTARSFGGSTTARVEVNRDATAPSISCPADVTIEAQSDAGAQVVVEGVSCRDGIDSAPRLEVTPASGATFPPGPTEVRAVATDAVGNLSACTFLVQVIDTTPPVLTCPDNLSVAATSAGGSAVVFTATASDVADPAPDIVSEPSSGSVLAPGKTIVRVTAVDRSGNVARCSFEVEVTDFEAGDGGVVARPRPSGCGCTSAPPAVTGWLLLLVATRLRRRRTTGSRGWFSAST